MTNVACDDLDFSNELILLDLPIQDAAHSRTIKVKPRNDSQ